MIVVDSSVAVPAALSWHERHATALSSLAGEPTRLLAQVGVETYSVLTRLPQLRRIEPEDALAFLRRRFAFPPATLTARSLARLFELVATNGIAGGAIYDAVVASTARELGATLLTLDRRAERTYRLLGIDYRFVT